MRQSTILVGVLLAAFAMYVVLRGDGHAWLALFVKHGAHETIAQTSTSSGSSGGSSTGSDLAKTAATAAEIAKVAAVVFA